MSSTRAWSTQGSRGGTALERAAADSDNILVLIGPDSPRAPGWNAATML